MKMPFATQSLHRWLAVTALAAGAGCGAAVPNAGLPISGAGIGRQPGLERPNSTQTMYVSALYTNKILGFPANADGNVAPTVKIAGSKTLLDRPFALTVDPASGNIFAANEAPDSRILIFPAGASGNVAPKVLAGSNVPVQEPGGMAVDSSGKLYVSDTGKKAIYVFAAGAQGNAAPIRTIVGSNTQLAAPCGMSFDSSGHLYVANIRDSEAPIEEFASGANGNVAPIATLGGDHVKVYGTYSLSLDRHDRIVVAYGEQIKIFAAGAHGNVAPTAIIKGSATKLVDGTTVGTSSNSTIYVTNVIDIPNHKASILAFDSTADGNTAPVRIISGSHTGVFDTWYPSFL